MKARNYLHQEDVHAKREDADTEQVASISIDPTPLLCYTDHIPSAQRSLTNKNEPHKHWSLIFSYLSLKPFQS